MSNIYSKDPIKVDLIACASAGNVLSSYVAIIEDSTWSNWSIKDKFTFKLIFISICHSINWDFLQNTLAEEFSKNPERLSANYLEKFNASILAKWLSEYEKPERIRAKERAELIRNIGQVVNDKFDGDVYNIYSLSDGTLYGKNGLHKNLSEFKAYGSDPLKKKANVLTHDLIRENILSFPDIDKIEPAIEYHIMRVYERTGRVFAKKSRLHMALKEGESLRPWFVETIREKVSEALSYTAGVAKQSVPDINYVEWQIARNICKQDNPNCIHSDVAPKELPEDVKRIFSVSCPYIDFCYSYSHPDNLDLKEPIPEQKKSHY
jgi:hypothetical protein